MADFAIPVGWKFYGANSGNQTTFTLPGHTVAEPHLAIFDRKVPVVQNGQSTVPSYRVRIIRGVADPDGILLSTRITCDLTIRWPLQATPADIMADMASLAAVVGDADFQDDVANELLLPR